MHEASRRTELDPKVIPFDLHAPLGGSPVKTTIIVPTRNESLNVAAFLGRLESVYSAAPLEVLFVDDSDDETPQEIEINAKHTPFPVRLVHREPGERRGGLSGAVLAGLAEARGDWIVVLDGDLQHPPELAERLAAVGRSRELDLVVASRYVESGDADGLSSPARHAVSGLSTMAAKMIFPRRVGRVSDPMSGFFAVRRAAIDPRRMRPTGYKILLEILVRHPRLRMAEAPFHMEDRHGGQSKASVRQGWAFLRHLTRLRGSVFARQVHRSGASSRLVWLVRAFQFGLIGLSGLAVNTGVLWLFNQHPLHLHYTLAAILATEASTSWLFILTESMVYRGEKPGSTLSRGLRFFLLNHVALAVRLPVLALLVDVLGLGVLVANAITLVLLFLVRFTIADAAIYGRGDRDTADPAPPREPIKLVIDVAPDRAQRPEENRQVPAPRSPRHLPYRYSLPGLATIGSQVRLPELEYFRAQWLGNDTEIQIRVGAVGDRRPLRRAIVTQLGSPPSIGYREHLGRFGANFRVDLGDPIEVVVSASLGRSPHVVYTNILEALLRFVAVSRGTMLLHAACVEIDGVAVLISARTDTGKTGTVLRLVRERGAKFLSDDMVVLHPDGRVGCFPKPLTISHHTLRAVDSHELSRGEWRKLRLQSRLHSREGRQFALVLAHLNLPIMGVNALTQRVVPPPKYTVDHLLPCEIIPESKATELFVIQRGDHGIGELSAEESMGTLLANTEDAYQFPPFRQLAPSIVIGEDDHLVLREKERRILESAVGRLRTRWVSTPDFTWADLIPELLGADQANGRLAAGRSA